jgi:hypothetical protein
MPPGRVSGPGRRMDNRIARGQVPEARPRPRRGFLVEVICHEMTNCCRKMKSIILLPVFARKHGVRP